ncbi:AAA family ATPase [Streptomyces sp. L2]|uniref:helix-turn-helix transcriptional regulator n=1 Tax=Streptomyces sp. L2 TaxID=2162665 RepID=UPI0010138569|nr:AAA family ATPase [Streptomyces sp. L2]
MELVDRADQLAELERLARHAQGGTSGVVVIEDSCGSGKTALLSAWTSQERLRGTRVLAARCSAAERDSPFGAIRQLFQGTPAALHVPAPSRAAAPPSTLFEPFEALCQMIRALGEDQAVVLAVDDLDLCDEQSAQWLGYATRRLDGLPTLLVATSTAAGTGTPTPGGRLGSGLVLDHPRSHRMVLPALTADGIDRLLRRTFGALPHPGPPGACLTDAGFSDTLRTVTGGNPRLVRDLLNALRGSQATAGAWSRDGLAALARHSRLRMTHTLVHREPTETVLFARVAAVLGEGADPNLVASLTGFDERAAAVALQDLKRIGAVSADAPGIVFSDAALREALENEVKPAERSALRIRAARSSHAAGATNEQVAGHLLLVSEPMAESWVIPALRAAAADALRRSAPEDAVAYLRRGLRQPVCEEERERLLSELGRGLLYRDPAVACRYLSEALATAANPARRARQAALLSTAHLLCGRLGAAVDVLLDTGAGLRSTVTAAEETGTGPLAGQEIDALLHVQWTLARAAGAQHRLPDAGDSSIQPLVRAAPQSTAGDEAQRLGVQALQATLAGQSASRTRTLAIQAFRSGLLVREGCAELAFFVALGLVCTDDLAEAERIFNEIASDAGRTGARVLLAAAALGRSMVHHRRGQIPEALAAVAPAVDELFELPAGCFRASAAAHMITVLLDCGRREEAAALAGATAGITGAGDMDGWESAVLSLAEGRLRAASGDPQGALTHVLECGRRLESQSLANPALLTWRSDAALLHAALGEPGPAHRLADEEVRLAERWGTPRAVGQALWALGVVTGGEAGRRALAAAVAHQEAAGARLELARTLIDYGAAQIAAGDLSQGRAHLRRAVDVAHQCGAVTLAERGLAELTNSGARPRAMGSDRWSALTSGELRVARLAASGARNREIAARLHVTSRAVERHLTSAYRKLGVSGRAGLKDALGRVHG